MRLIVGVLISSEDKSADFHVAILTCTGIYSDSVSLNGCKSR